jgi:hypothetical protein
MILRPVTSSNIESIGYDPDTRKLHVKFASAVYEYDDVSSDEYAGLMAAESLGGHLHSHIKGEHSFRKLDDKPEVD